MNDKKQNRREDIVEKANRLVYTKGFNQTSFADIADELGITKGNLHYHFNSKEELLEAIIAFRVDIIKTNLAQWDEAFPDPIDKLKRFVQMLLNEEKDVVRYGCPIGSLNMELGKYQQSMQEKSRILFDLFLNWLEKIFKQLGKKNSKSLSRHLLAMAQGTALMTYVYADKKLLKEESVNIINWIESL